MPLLLNAAISLIAELCIGLCALIAFYMIDTKLGLTVTGLITIKQIADFLIRQEHAKNMKNLFDNSEKL